MKIKLNKYGMKQYRPESKVKRNKWCIRRYFVKLNENWSDIILMLYNYLYYIIKLFKFLIEFFIPRKTFYKIKEINPLDKQKAKIISRIKNVNLMIKKWQRWKHLVTFSFKFQGFLFLSSFDYIYNNLKTIRKIRIPELYGKMISN